MRSADIPPVLDGLAARRPDLLDSITLWCAGCSTWWSSASTGSGPCETLRLRQRRCRSETRSARLASSSCALSASAGWPMSHVVHAHAVEPPRVRGAAASEQGHVSSSFRASFEEHLYGRLLLDRLVNVWHPALMCRFDLDWTARTGLLGAESHLVCNPQPAFVFAGEQFDSDPQLRLCKSILLDLFRGRIVENINLKV